MLLAFTATTVWAQSRIVAPYSAFGIGDLSENSLAHSSSRAGLELAMYNPTHIFVQNPALLANSRLSIFEITTHYKKTSYLQGSKKSVQNDGNISGAYMAFPIAKFWSASIGFNPYSRMSYYANTYDTLDNGNTVINYTREGFGGLNQVTFANGFKVYKELNLGISGSYTFGNIQKNDVIYVDPVSSSVRTGNAFTENYQTRGLILKAGAYYRAKLSEKYFLNSGLTYQKGQKMSMDILSTREVLFYNSPANGYTDTLLNKSSNLFLPQQLQIGFSIEKYHKLVLGVDLSTNTYSQFTFNGSKSGNFVNGSKIIVGGEYTPDYFSTVSYFKRCTYKFGLKYEKTPLLINSTQINNFGINFGLELPTDKQRSFVNLGMELGSRGTTNANLVKENYIKVNLGLTLNDRWFIKRKII